MPLGYFLTDCVGIAPAAGSDAVQGAEDFWTMTERLKDDFGEHQVPQGLEIEMTHKRDV